MYICGYNPYFFCIMSENEFFSMRIMLGWLGVAALLLLLAICVFIVWGCALVHWLLAAGVGCLLALGWVLVAVLVVARRAREL